MNADQLLDLFRNGWRVYGHDLKYNMRWTAYDGISNLSRKYPSARTIRALVKKGEIVVVPDEHNPGYFIAKLPEHLP